MPCHIHGLSEPTLPHDSRYNSDYCSECIRLGLEAHRGYYEYLDEDNGRLVETDGNTQSHDHWVTFAYEYEDASESKDQSDGGDSTEVFHASDDTSSADTRALNTPTSSSEQPGDHSMASRDPGFFPDADLVREDGPDIAATGHIDPDWTSHCLNLEDPWSTFNRRADRMQVLAYPFGYDGYGYQAEETEHDGNQVAAPSQSG